MRNFNFLLATVLLSVCLSAQVPVPVQSQSTNHPGAVSNGTDGSGSSNKINSGCGSFDGSQDSGTVMSCANGQESRTSSGARVIEYYGTPVGNEEANLLIRSTESRPSNLNPNNYQGYANLNFHYDALAGGNNSFNGTGSKTNYWNAFYTTLYRTVGQKVGIADNLYSTSAGDTLPFEIYVSQFGGYGTSGDEQTIGIEDLLYQGDGTKDSIGGVAKGTITGIDTGTGVVNYMPVSGEGTMGEQRFIRDIGSKYAIGTYSAIANSGGSPNTVTVTGSGTSWTSIPGFVGIHTTFNNMAKGGEILTNNLVFCPGGGANDGFDFCMPITTGIDDTHLTLNLYSSGPAMNTYWPSHIPTSGRYAIYRSAWPTNVNTITHTFTACNPVAASRVGSCDVSGLTNGHTFDQVMAYNMAATGLRIALNRSIGMPYQGAGIDIQNQGDSGSPKALEGMQIDGNFHRVIGVGYDGLIGAPDYFLDAHKDFNSGWFFSRVAAISPFIFLQYLDSSGELRSAVTINRNDADSPGISFFGMRIDTHGNKHEGGTAPTASKGHVTGTNAGGYVSGLNAATSVTITFADAGWKTWSSCTASPSVSLSAAPYVSSISQTEVTFAFPALTGTLYYSCNGN